MYESHFEFIERPFAAAPLPAGYVPAANIEHARQALIRCVERAEGVGLVIGSAGTGKTLLCQLIAEHFRQRQFQVALLTNARLETRRSLLQNVLFELNLPYRGMDDEELRLSLIDHLTPRGSAQGGLVLIVDEAHTLPLRLLEEMRQISNFIQGGQMRVRLVLAGGPAMEERLANPKLESLAQRIAARCYLAPLNREETYAYVRSQIERVGGHASVIASEAVLRAIHQASDGIPRLINQVCDHALILASLDGQKVLTPRRIEQAWADLQQLPAPWHETAKSPLAAASAGAIEFGQLGEDSTAAGQQIELPVGDPLGSHALAELDQIDQTIGALNQESAAEVAIEDRPATEVEMLLDSSVDPFGSGFDEEEVIIDRYASLEARTLPDRSKVASSEGEAIGRAIAGHAAAQIPRADAEPIAVDLQDERPAVRLIEADGEESSDLSDIAAGDDFHPADDPVMPEVAETRQPEYHPLPPSQSGDDDRDLIVVQNAQAVAPPQRRRRYRQLFSSLRKG